jgi:aspartyl-tRNA(Asn)/glutamyl-tRNA(Gln) amidotransferase subunit A
MAHAELEWLPAYRLRELIRSKQLSPVELARLTLERIERLNPELNAFLAVTADKAMDSARAVESRIMSGEEPGLLGGIPIPIKDIEELAGVRHTSGSLVFKDRVATVDSLAVERIKRAGAVIVGKTNTSEFGQIGTCENLLGDACRNPWDTSLTSGASSAGAAVSVAVGITPIAQGGDGGGSIRIPAGFCGIYGIKPSQGRVPRRHTGLDSWHPVKFAQVGPLSRNVRDAAILLQVLAGPAEDGERDAIQSPPPDFVTAVNRDIRGLRAAWSRDLGGVAVDPAVAAIAGDAARAFEGLGATVEETDLRLASPQEVFHVFETIYNARVWATSGHLLADHAGELSDYFREGLERGREVAGAELFHAMSRLEQFRAAAREFFASFDLLLTPTLAVPPFPIGEHPEEIDGVTVPHRHWGFTPFTYPFNMCGNPAASVPAGFTKDGLPVGLQIVGRLKDEATVLAASARFEEARPWAHMRPPLALN